MSARIVFLVASTCYIKAFVYEKGSFETTLDDEGII
jgi:hypothetical protein